MPSGLLVTTLGNICNGEKVCLPSSCLFIFQSKLYLQTLPLDPRNSHLVGPALAISTPDHFPGHRELLTDISLLSPAEKITFPNCSSMCQSLYLGHCVYYFFKPQGVDNMVHLFSTGISEKKSTMHKATGDSNPGLPLHLSCPRVPQSPLGSEPTVVP